MEIKELHILSYLEGSMSDDERTAFESELEKSASLQKEVDDLRFLLEAMDNIKNLNKVDTIARWEKLSLNISLLKIKYKTLKSFRIISVLAFLPFIGLIGYLSERLYENNLQAREIIEVKSAYGLVSKILLPDSSVVFLNSGSTLSYPQRFTEEVRTVSLTGEAYFVVKASPDQRFEVRISDHLSVNAYGTEFNINAYEGQEWISTALANGHISVCKQEGNQMYTIMQPGQLAVYNKSTKEMDVSDINLYVATAWKDGKIVFRRARMPEIIYRLSKHFNVEIELKDKALTQYEFSATFTTESLTEILNLMKQASPIRWHYVEPKQQNDGTYTKRKVIISLRW